MAPAFRPYDAREQGPTALRQPEPGLSLSARRWKLSLTSLQIRSVYLSIALPEEGRFAGVVVRRERFPILPDAARTRMVLKPAPDSRQVLHDRNSQPPQFSLIPHSRLNPHLRHVKRPN